MEAVLWPYRKCVKCARINLCEESYQSIANCLENGFKDFRPITNADRIRQMSDEELADVLDHVQGDAFLVGVGQRKNSLYPGAGVSWIDWLKQEVESDG